MAEQATGETGVDVAKLRALLETVKELGEWRACPVNRDGKDDTWVCPCASVHCEWGIIASVPPELFGPPGDRSYHQQEKERQQVIAAIMDLIAAAHNAMPALLAAAEERDRLREALVHAIGHLGYYVGNPSAWPSGYDAEVSESIRRVVNTMTAALNGGTANG